MIAKEYTLAEICSRLSSGKAIKAEQICPKGQFPVFGGNGVRGYTNNYNFNGECAIIGRQGAYCGNVNFFKGMAYMTEHAVVVCGNEKCNTKFLSFVLQRMNLGHLSHQAAQPGLSVKILGEQKISLPSIEIQNKIADILSKYDNLIENNQKQIKLLEEAAQRLYKEWFIDLHFPGYESASIIDGVPEGWIKSILSEIAYESGKNEKKSNRDNYKSYLPIDCIPKKSLGYIQTADIKLAESSLISFKNSDVIFGAMRPYFHKVVVARENGLTRSTCFVLNSLEKEMWAYLVMLLFSKDTIEYATQISVGTTMPYTRWSDLSKMPIIIPSKEICLKFNEVIIPIIDKINCLCQEIIRLTEARDRLLPKLMNGEIEV